MLKNLPLKIIMIFVSALLSQPSLSVDGCPGRLLNPATDVCWQCLFPIIIGGIPLTAPGQVSNGDPIPPPICACPAPPPVFIRPGIGVSFWEPARISEVVRQPMCSPTLGGVQLGAMPVPRGTHNQGDDDTGNAFYHVHWFDYPILEWVGELLSDVLCPSSGEFNALYMTELDPVWDSDALSFLINPEAALFANASAQALCAADAVKAATTQFGFDALFWCSGSQGSLYPLSGSHANHIGGVESALALTHTMAFKLHRQLIEWDTSSPAAMCGPVPQPLLRKNQYKAHIVYPIPWVANAHGFGAQSAIWGAGREFPYVGEDFSYLIWRKKACCAL